MPVTARGKKIVEKRTGKVVGTSTSHAKAQRSANARNAARHGWRPTGAPARGSRGRAKSR